MSDILKNIYEKTLRMTPIDTTPFQSKRIEPIAFYLGESPKSYAYGKIYGCFRLQTYESSLHGRISRAQTE